MPSARRSSSSTRSISASAGTSRSDLGCWLGLAKPANELLGLADRQLLADDGVEHAGLVFGRQSAKRPAVALGQTSVGDRGLDVRRQVQEAKRVRHGRTGAPDAVGDVVLAQPEAVHQLAIGVGRLEGIEVGALEVLDERELELVAIDQLADDGRNAIETGRLRRTQAALAGHELVAGRRLGHEDRLEHAVRGDARAERGQVLRGEPLARLVRVRADPRDRDLHGAGVSAAAWRDEGAQAATEAG